MHQVKQAIVGEIRNYLTQSDFVIAVDYQGLPVAQFDALRGVLRQRQAQLHVVPNRLLRKAAQGLPAAPMAESVRGPTAIVVGGDGIEALRDLKKFAQANQRPRVQCGLFDGRLFSAGDLEVLANLPPRQVLYGMLVGTLAAPMTRLAGVLRQKVCSLLYVLKAVEEKKNKAAQ